MCSRCQVFCCSIWKARDCTIVLGHMTKNNHDTEQQFSKQTYTLTRGVQTDSVWKLSLENCCVARILQSSIILRLGVPHKEVIVHDTASTKRQAAMISLLCLVNVHDCNGISIEITHWVFCITAVGNVQLRVLNLWFNWENRTWKFKILAKFLWKYQKCWT